MIKSNFSRWTVALAALVTSFICMPLMADTIELADGSILEGDFVGSSNGVIMFNTGDGIEAYPEDQVTGVFFSSGVQTATAAASQSGNLAGSSNLTMEFIDIVAHAIGYAVVLK